MKYAGAVPQPSYINKGGMIQLGYKWLQLQVVSNGHKKTSAHNFKWSQLVKHVTPKTGYTHEMHLHEMHTCTMHFVRVL